MSDRRHFSAIPMRKLPPAIKGVARIATAVVFTAALSVASAEEAGLKDGAKHVGHALGAAARDIGKGAKKAGKAVGDAAKAGGREFRRAFKGESH
jgi:hypothetical protein